MMIQFDDEWGMGRRSRKESKWIVIGLRATSKVYFPIRLGAVAGRWALAPATVMYDEMNKTKMYPTQQSTTTAKSGWQLEK